MFEFTGKLKTITFVLMLIGAVSIGASFFMGGGHHEGGEHTEHHQADASHSGEGDHPAAEHHGAEENHHEAAGDGHAVHGDHPYHADPAANDEFHKGASRATRDNNHFYSAEELHDAEHAHHQMQNKPWANLLVNNFFFLAIALGALFFLAIQYAAQAGWAIVVTRVMEAMSQFLIIPVLIMIVLIAFGLSHSHYLWHWMQEGIMTPGSENYDEIIAGKEGYLNGPFYMIRTVVYLIGWVGAALLLRKMSKSLETTNDPNRKWVKMRNLSAGFLVFFAVTSSTSAWDWIMSIDTHWFSTLFGWYVFAGMFVSALTVLTLLVLFLKSIGYLKEVNHSHIQDLGKFMFAFSIFWTYLWFSQFMLIWYSNIPEEVTYYMARWGEFKGLFFAMVAMNFLFPVLVLMSRDTKRNYGFLITAGIIMIVGHWLDVYIMITPGTVGANWSIGLVQIGTFLGYAGLFLFVVFSSLAKAKLMPEGHPMLQESKYHHI
ncbi:MAG: quinol:cytochrome C oxidoreductase [Owenweeksia sp.]